MFKRIILLLVVILFSANMVFAEWRQVSEGTYVGNFSRNNDFLIYSTKVYKSSDMWQQYMNSHNFSEENMENFGSMIINSIYDCATSRIKIDSVQVYDKSGNQISDKSEGDWKEDTQGFGRAMCVMYPNYW